MSHGHYSLYDVLGIPPDANQREIKSAYRRLAKQYHPDVNPSAEASARMAEVNDAYSILNDPVKKAAYDAGIELGAETFDKEAPTVSEAESMAQRMACQGCGRFDHTLRIVAFPYVLSFILWSQKRYESGIFCDHCRSTKSTKWAFVSLLFGWWGFPWGIIWTLESLLVNAGKGKMPKEENRQLLSQLSWVNAALGMINEAKATLRDLLKYGKNKEAKEFKDELDRTYPTIPAARVGGIRLGFITMVATVFLVYGLIGNAIFSEPTQQSSPVNVPPTELVPVKSPEPAPLIKPDKSAVEVDNKVEEQVVVNAFPFTYKGKGKDITPPFRIENRGSTIAESKLTFITNWDGDISIRWCRAHDNVVEIERNTGPPYWYDFPNNVKPGTMNEFIFTWDTNYDCYLYIEHVPENGEWEIFVSNAKEIIESDVENRTPPEPIPSPIEEVDITVIIEYEGDWKGSLKGISGIVTSGNKSLTWENIEVPVEYTARKIDGGTGPLTVKIVYEGQVVTEKTIVEQDEVHVIWEGPQK